MQRIRIIIWTTLAITILGACGARYSADRHPEGVVAENSACAGPGSVAVCGLDGYPDRPYEIHVPASYSPDRAGDLWINLHGGGGSMESAALASCPDGDATHPSCIHNLGEAHGFITVYPNGTGSGLLANLRTWNAGGDGVEFYCASGRACRDDVDDIEYIGALLDELDEDYAVERVFVSGLSNGAAMAHRVACELGDRITGIAAIGGANQYSTTAPCEPPGPVAILQIHGTEDPCWRYEGGEDACIDRSGGLRIAIPDSNAGWAQRNGCEPAPSSEVLADLDPGDGVITTRLTWTGCDDGAEVVHLRMEGAGHTWPDGKPAISRERVGATSRDWDTGLIWGFFASL